MRLSRGALYLAAGIATLVTVSQPAHTQGYPSRPITMIVPFPAGGGTDVNARIVSEHMSRTLGQPIVIENIAGAGGTTGTARAMRAEPNGYTIEMGQMGNGLVPNLNRPGGNTTGVSFLSSASVTCATYMQPLAKTELSMTITD
jgi:tripartite-type tricarboxylate transporter receptor subunit TctC